MLPAERSLRIERGSHVCITCLSGLLWVTQEGDLRDLFPVAGDSLELSGDGVVLITALEPSVVSTREVPVRLSRASIFNRLSRAVRHAATACMRLHPCA
jgi:hypothetical protein